MVTITSDIIQYSFVRHLRVAIFLVSFATLSAAWATDRHVSILEFSDLPRSAAVELTAQGFDVDTCSDGHLQVYADAKERARIDALGYAYTVVGHQPNPPNFSDSAKGVGTYHSYNAMAQQLQAAATVYPAITQLVSVGTSVQGRYLWALRITDNPLIEEDEPEFKFISSIHGDEVLGVELCLYLIDHLLSNYGEDTEAGERATTLVNETDIWIMPLMNPDGHIAGTRRNAHNVDLNRNFPSYTLDNGLGTLYDGDPFLDGGREPETVAVMNWTAENSFVLSGNIHGGALVMNYPYDDGDAPAGEYAIAPDDALFIDISKRYSVTNTPLWNSPSFPMGISNGSDWYTVFGGLQDWSYRYMSCFDITMELSNSKRPLESDLPLLWGQNQESMLTYIEATHIGIRGLVTDFYTGDPLYARIVSSANSQPVYTDPDVGDYHRMLLPGTYDITVDAAGYEMVTVANIAVGAGAATRIDLRLFPEGSEGEPGSIPHDADQDANYHVDLSEILRVIQFYNTGGLFCDENTEDGYAAGTGDTSCAPHNSDFTPQDWKISLSEVLRSIQIFNADSYFPCPAGEDGYCPVFSL